MRALARKYEVHRRTVREALTSAWPEPRKKLPPRKSRLDPFKPAVDQMLRADLDAPRKQVHTVKRVFDRLVAEHEMEGISYATVADYVRWRRPEIRVEEGRGPAQVFIPQAHQPGAEAEVDFGDVWIMLAGVLTKCYLFTFRLSYSGKSVHRVIHVLRAGGVLRGPRARVRHAGRRPVRQGPLRQLAVSGRAGAGLGPGPGGDRPVGGLPLALRARTRSTASPASKAPTRKAAWRARSAGSAATAWSPSPRSARWRELNDDGRRVGR